MIDLRAAAVAWRVLSRAQLREQPMRVVATVLAIALGVALGVAVYLINSAALTQFDQASRRLIGDADLVVRGSSAGFTESVFVDLTRDASVQFASPMLELQLALAPVASDRPPLRVLGLDPFRAAALQPQIIAALGADIPALFAHDAIVLSRAAADALGLHRRERLSIIVAGAAKSLNVIDILPDDVYPEPLGIMDIAAAQWTLERLGRINRIDLRLRPGEDPGPVRRRLSMALPAGVFAVTAPVEHARAGNATRAYRVNLDMLALVALLTGAFLVFSTQWLSVLRRRIALGLLRSLGVTRTELRLALLAESAASGALGSVLGVLLGVSIAALMLRFFGADLGNRQLAAMGAGLSIHAAPVLGFALIGTGVACAGGALPAWQAAKRAPALALKAGDAEQDLGRLGTTKPGLALMGIGALLAWLPAVGGLPLPGYLAIAALLIGSVLLVPALTRRVMGAVRRTGRVVLDTALEQLRGSLSSSTVSLAAMIVSFSLMVAMAIMVHSFRTSFETWLGKLLPADLQVFSALGGDTSTLSAAAQSRIAALPGVARAEFQRIQPVLLRADQPAIALIAREVAPNAADTLPMLREARQSIASALPPVWITEVVQDRYGYEPGQSLALPLAGVSQAFFVAGVWRDYVHAAGALVVRRQDYIAATGDRSATQASLWLQPRAGAAAIEAGIRALAPDDTLELISSPELRERSLAAFDRAFVITYGLEAVAVLIGLVGVSVAATATALARRAQFGMFRHLGMLRRQVLWMLATEGIALSLLAVLYGLLLGAVLSLILVYVINRQSFNWSIDLAVPWLQLAALSLALIAAAAITALWGGRAALSQDPIRAVREDW